MTIGFPVDKNALDNKAGSVAMGLRDTLNEVAKLNAWLNTKTATDLEQYGYSIAEANALKGALTDLNALALVANGKQAQPGANDFFFNARNLWGVN